LIEEIPGTNPNVGEDAANTEPDAAEAKSGFAESDSSIKRDYWDAEYIDVEDGCRCSWKCLYEGCVACRYRRHGGLPEERLIAMFLSLFYYFKLLNGKLAAVLKRVGCCFLQQAC
jgi:hypothetical protein